MFKEMFFLFLSIISLHASQEQIVKANGIDIKTQALKIGKRPQEPIGPLPYEEEEVSFTNSVDGVTLSGTLTFPRIDGPFPAVVLIQGSAPLDRDSAHYGHRPFLVWADYLTRQGVAVLRFDKRGAGKSTGDYETSTIQDFAQDALAAVTYLKNRKEVAIEQIGLIGHSEGGMTASLAASLSSDIAFILLMASPCVNWEDLIVTQEIAIERIDGVDETTIAKSLAFHKQAFEVLKQEENREKASMTLLAICSKYAESLDRSERKIAESYFGPIESQVPLLNSAWFRFALNYDPATVLKQLTIPILALNGEMDFIVSCEQNLKRIAAALKEINHPDYTIISFPKLNHAFQTCQTGSVSEYALIEETVCPLILEIMGEWIATKTNGPKKINFNE